MRLLTALALLPTAVCLLFAGGCSIRLGTIGSGFGRSIDAVDCWNEATETIVVPAAGLERVGVDSHYGSITVTAAAGAESVTVVATKRAGGRDEADARAAQAQLRITQRCVDGAVEFAVGWADERAARDWAASVAFEVTVPARFGATLDSHHGNVTVRGLSGPVIAASHHGAVELCDVGGRAVARSHHGDVTCTTSHSQVTLASHHGDVRLATTASVTVGSLRSHHGDLEIDLPSGACGTVRGSSRGVDAHADGADANFMVVQIDDDDFTVQLREPKAGDLEANTHHGCVRLR